MAIFGNDARVNATFTATDKATPVIKSLRREVTSLGSKTGGPLGGLLSGLGGLNLGMIGATAVGVGFVGMLGDAVKAAADEDIGIQRLNASLKANVPNWQDVTGAVDDFINKGEALAFTDDDIRNSIAQLVTRTHDAAKAFDLTRQAMDLARLRGISLASATDIIGKVYGGNIGILSRYGIAVKKGATATEALAQIQDAAAGQAESYANTTEGAYQRIGIRIQDLKEDIGHKLQPVIDVALQGMAELFNPPAAVQSGSALDALITANLTAAAASGDLNASADQVSQTLADLGGQAGDTTNFLIQFGKALISGQGEAELGAIALGKYADELGVSMDALNVYVQSGLKAGLTIDQMREQLQALAKQQALHNRMLEQQASQSDAAASSTRDLAQAQQEMLDLLNQPGANLELLVMPRKRSVERDAQSIGRAYGDGLKSGLESQKRRVAAASADLNFAIKHPFAVLHEYSYIVGQLTGDRLAKGLKSKKPEVRAAAEAYRAELRAELSGAPSYFWGSQVGADYIAGLYAAGLVKTPFGWGVKFNTGIQSDWTWHIPSSGPGSGGGGRHHKKSGGTVEQGGAGASSTHVHVHLDGKEIAHAVDKQFGIGWNTTGSSSSRN